VALLESKLNEILSILQPPATKAEKVIPDTASDSVTETKVRKPKKAAAIKKVSKKVSKVTKKVVKKATKKTK
jgi:ElaB/YqjD/DUF883 family membrane-anchored ribosome-binding protein